MNSTNDVRFRQILCVMCAVFLCVTGCGDADSESPRNPSSAVPVSSGGDRDGGTDSDVGHDGDAGSYEAGDECSTAGAMGCEAGQLQFCSQGERVETYDCGAHSCEGNDRCAGDRCEAAIEVEAGTTDAPAIVAGHRQAYGYTGFFDALNDCGDEQTSVDDESSELFLEIQGLSSGDELVIESVGQGNYVFYVFDNCQAGACVHAQSVDGEVGDGLANRMRWTLTQDRQSLLVAVRASDLMERPFEFKVVVESN